MAAHTHLFLSTVSAEFRSYRGSLRPYLERPNLTAKVQEDFIATGEETLDKLDDYIRQCNAVVHLVGDMTGATAKPPSVTVIRERYPDFATRFPMLEPFLRSDGPSLSYTQWEAWLALYHRKALLIAVPEEDAPRDEGYQLVEAQRIAQQEHLARLKQNERYPEIKFSNVDQLAAKLLHSRLNDILPPPQIASATLNRWREIAASMLEVGKVNWKMPQFVASLELEANETRRDSESRATNITVLKDVLSRGTNLVFYGEGGVGKTTFLLEISGALLADQCPRIPLYIDAADWASTNTEILEYITSRPVAVRNGVTSSELLKIAETGCLSLAINGWNEVPASQKLVCLRRLRELITAAPLLNIAVVTRSATDVPELNVVKQVHVRGLTWKSQVKMVRSELDETSASIAVDLLARDTQLRHAARSPIILKGLITLAKKGVVASQSNYDLLGATVEAFEEDDQRRPLLEEQPIDSRHRCFLEAVAFYLTSNQTITSSTEELLPVISEVCKQLVDSGRFGVPPTPSAVLNALSNHHLLHADGQSTRFAHQKFQEYFTAARLLRACNDGSEKDVVLLKEAINQPFWEDALILVAGKLQGSDGNAKARSLLVRTALEVDLGFACDLAGICGVSEIDDGALYRDLVTRVNALCDSPLPEVVNYGVICLIATGFPIFSDRLWALIESDERQIRFNAYRVNGNGISLKQLGPDAELRITTWSPDRQVELIHELADNSENYDYLVRIANESAEDEVRSAAISSLAWNFPASEAILRAWLNAPVALQLQPELINVVEYMLENEPSNDIVKEKLMVLSNDCTSEDIQLRLALAFPEETALNAIEAVLNRLREVKYSDAYAMSLEDLAKKHAPERLKKLARELVLSECVVHDWAQRIVQGESPEARAEIFEAAWGILVEDSHQRLSAQVVGALASREQILRSVSEWLVYCQDRRGKLSEVEREKGRQIGYLLACASGEDLLSVIMELGEGASYTEATELLDLVLNRIRFEDDRSSESRKWAPSPEAVQTLITIFGSKSGEEVVPQHKINVLLCCIASYVAPSEFGEVILEGCRKHLDAWAEYRIVQEQWIKNPVGNRPSNPYLGMYLITAVKNWGFDAIPGLLELLEHPQANELIPEAILGIVSSLWESKRKGIFQSLETDFKEGEQRRLAGCVLCQTEEAYQETTDVVARNLGSKLIELVDQLQVEKAASGDEWNEKYASYRTRSLLNAVANTPSVEIVNPVTYTVVNGPIDVYGAVGALQALIRQGLFVEDSGVVARIDALYSQEAEAKWFDDSKRHVMSQLCQIMFLVRPVSLLNKPLNYYLAEWQRFCHVNEIIRHLSETPSEDSWHCLLEIGSTLEPRYVRSEDFAFALTDTLTLDHFAEFLDLIADGTWFKWCRNVFHLERLAPRVLSIIGDDTTNLDAFLDACERSVSPYADGFACAVLSLVPDGDAIRMRYGLSALDAGRIENSRHPVCLMLGKMFSLHVPLDAGDTYEVHPRACNQLRLQLYRRAKGDNSVAVVARLLLADVECRRWESGRPVGEHRHPSKGEGRAWTEVLGSVD